MGGPDATEVRDTFPGREPSVTLEVAVADEPVGVEKETLVPDGAEGSDTFPGREPSVTLEVAVADEPVSVEEETLVPRLVAE